MKVLVLGGSGMLGHKMWQACAPRFDTYLTLRGEFAAYARLGLFDESRTVSGVSIENFESVKRALAMVHPDVVINCIGIVKQDAAARDAVPSITVNSLFPHLLALSCREEGARLIHLSTDCVFSGRKGHYVESDLADAGDLYGRSKLLGEVGYENCLTIRTSMIGRELKGAHGLIQWFLSEKGKQVRGFRRAVFSGFTTTALSEVICDIIVGHAGLQGLYHVSADPITKFDLLSLVKEVYGLPIEIEPDETFVCDRSLDSARFRAITGFVPRSWAEMITEMLKDPTPYEDLRKL